MTTETGHATPSLHSTTVAGLVPPTDHAVPAAALNGHTGLAPAGAVTVAAFTPITPPPPIPAPRHASRPGTPPGPLGDLAYRWLARVALIGVPDSSGTGRPTVLTLAAAHVLAAAMPLPLFIRDPESTPAAPRLTQVGTVTSVYRLDPPTGPAEICASGEFDLGRPGAAALVAELTRAAEYDRPLTGVAQLDSLEYAGEAEGAAEAGVPRVLTDWRITGLVIGQSTTWPGCHLVPDAAQVSVQLGGVSYLMRRHHDRQVWRTLLSAWRAATASGAPTWEALTRSLNVVGAATTSEVHDQIAGRLFDPADLLTLGSLMATLPGIVERLETDDHARGIL